jgi:hypothetical protein
MYRVTLSDAQRHELRARTRQAGLAPSTRDRLRHPSAHSYTIDVAPTEALPGSLWTDAQNKRSL